VGFPGFPASEKPGFFIDINIFMLRFKQFLILEDTTINQRKYLESVYGKENAEKMIASIRQRESELGGTKEYLNYADKFPSVKEKKKIELSRAGLNPDLIADPHVKSQVDSTARSLSGMSNAQIDTFNTFAVPIYSDTSLDRPIDVKVTKMKQHPSLVAAGLKDDGAEAAATATPVGDRPENQKGTITINQDYWLKDWSHSAYDVYSLPKNGNWFKNIARGDDFGHELTHTAQPNWDYSTSDRKPLPQTEYNSNKPASKETLQRRTYTQDAFEPAARMSELKHLYHARTGNLLPANMTADDKTNFKSWYDKSNVKDENFDDTVQLIDTPEGDELFRRTAKVNKSKNQNQGMA